MTLKEKTLNHKYAAKLLTVSAVFNYAVIFSQVSADSTLMRTKRRAPPPPCADAHQAKGTALCSK